jgi:carbon storage regulator
MKLHHEGLHPMLIFTLEIGELFHVGDDVRVQIVSVSGTRVRVGIDAPRTLEVDRDKVRRNKRTERDRDQSTNVQ